MHSSSAIPVIVENFPERPVDWVGVSSLAISGFALAVALWSVLWTRKAWEREGARLKVSVRFGADSAVGSGRGEKLRYRCVVTVSNLGRTSTQVEIAGVEFYRVNTSRVLDGVFPIGERLTLGSGHFVTIDRDIGDFLTIMRGLDHDLGAGAVLVITASGLERFSLDQNEVGYMRKIIGGG